MGVEPPPLAAKLAFLLAPDALHDGAAECIETHMSCVVLTEHRAWKLKKPVRLPFVDYSTLARRRISCETELRLGQRLAPSVYLGLASLIAGADGLALAGPGEIVEWMVVMRRLSAASMLPQMLARGAATESHAEAVAALLAEFYRHAPRARWPGPVYRSRLHDTVQATARELEDRGAQRSALAGIVADFLRGLEREAAVLDARVAAGRVVEAHGDLRPEHVCLETPPLVIDPLEFDEELRTLDAVSELAFFALECDRLDAGWFGERVLAHYATRSADLASPQVIALYQRQHALTRAVIALRHLDDVPPDQHARWHARAAEYLERARRLRE
jgi:aminoglycoside phosphotransferase family enzyme